MSLIADFLILALTLIGFAALSASMNRHAKQISNRSSHIASPGIRRLRLMVGWHLLALALYPAIKTYGISIGIAVWIGFLAISATAIALLLSCRPKMLRPVFAVTVTSSFIAGLALTVFARSP